MNLRHLVFAICTMCVLALSVPLHAAEIKGKVVESGDKTVRVAVEADLVPVAGDAVEIYFEIPGLDEPVSVASGKVRSVDGGNVEVTIEKSSAKPEKNHLVRITSANPARRMKAGTPAKPTPVPATPSAPVNAPAPVKSALVGPLEDSRQMLPVLAKLLPEKHLTRRLLDDEVSRRWLNNYLTALDPYKSYLYQSDADQFLARRDELDDLCRRGDASFAYEIYRIFLARVDERIALAKSLIAESADLPDTAELISDFATSKFASSEAQIREIWKRRVRYLVLSQEANSVAPDEIPARVERQLDAMLGVLRELDDDELISVYLDALATAYDPHSSVLTAKRVEGFETSNRQQLEGIGASLRIDSGNLLVVQIVPGGAAAIDGRLKSGDHIVGIGQGESGNMENTSGRKLNDIVALIRGKAGTIVRLRVIPKGQADDVTYSIVRKRIQTYEATGTLLERGRGADGQPFRIGYIQLASLYSTTFQSGPDNKAESRSSTSDVRQLLTDPQTGLKARGADLIILDLRFNGGGPLAESVNLPGLFLDKGPVMQVKSNDGKVNHYDDDEAGVAWDGPLIVLTNRYTASGAEIVAAALQDYGRALVVGDSGTNGLGTVQSLFDIAKEGGLPAATRLGYLKVTTQQFYRVTGESMQLRGVTPDVLLPSATEGHMYGESFLTNALPPDSVKPLSFAKLDRYSSSHKVEINARAARRRAASAELQRLAAVPPPRRRTSIRLSIDTVRATLAETSGLEAMASPNGDLTPNPGNDEALAIALDALQQQLVARGKAAYAKTSYVEAIAAHRDAALLTPDDAEAHYQLAWLLATCPDKRFRSGPQSVESAQTACTLSQNREWRHILALAVAQAEAGDFANARETLQKALGLASEVDRSKFQYLSERFSKGQTY